MIFFLFLRVTLFLYKKVFIIYLFNREHDQKIPNLNNLN